MGSVHSSEEIRKVVMAFDRALESKDLQAIIETFAGDCEIELLGVRLFGKAGAEKWFNWLYRHVAEMKLLPVTVMVEGDVFFEEYVVEAKFYGGEEASLASGKPMEVCTIGGDFTQMLVKMLEEDQIPAYPTLGRAVSAIGSLIQYSKTRQDIEKRLDLSKVDKS